MNESARCNTTYEDLFRLPDNLVGEIIAIRRWIFSITLMEHYRDKKAAH